MCIFVCFVTRLKDLFCHCLWFNNQARMMARCIQNLITLMCFHSLSFDLHIFKFWFATMTFYQNQTHPCFYFYHLISRVAIFYSSFTNCSYVDAFVAHKKKNQVDKPLPCPWVVSILKCFVHRNHVIILPLDSLISCWIYLIIPISLLIIIQFFIWTLHYLWWSNSHDVQILIYFHLFHWILQYSKQKIPWS